MLDTGGKMRRGGERGGGGSSGRKQGGERGQLEHRYTARCREEVRGGGVPVDMITEEIICFLPFFAAG